MGARFGRPPIEGIISKGFKLDVIEDPGDAGAIPNNRSGACRLTTAAAETRTLARPLWEGQVITLFAKSIAAGACVITVSQTINQATNTTITLDTLDDYVVLMGALVADDTLKWRVILNNGATLG